MLIIGPQLVISELPMKKKGGRYSTRRGIRKKLEVVRQQMGNCKNFH